MRAQTPSKFALAPLFLLDFLRPHSLFIVYLFVLWSLIPPHHHLPISLGPFKLITSRVPRVVSLDVRQSFRYGFSLNTLGIKNAIWHNIQKKGVRKSQWVERDRERGREKLARERESAVEDGGEGDWRGNFPGWPDLKCQ